MLYNKLVNSFLSSVSQTSRLTLLAIDIWSVEKWQSYEIEPLTWAIQLILVVTDGMELWDTQLVSTGGMLDVRGNLDLLIEKQGLFSYILSKNFCRD
jgi:hypothetical protein